MQGFLEHIVNNSSNLISFFQTTKYLLKYMDTRNKNLVQKL